MITDKLNDAQRYRPLNANVLPYVTTTNARELDLLRAAVGDDKLNYLGFSYGTFLGATYGSLFPGNLGRVVLDGSVDANEYINNPMDDLSAQTSAFERAIGRFFQACAADPDRSAAGGRRRPADRRVEQRYKSDLRRYLQAGKTSYNSFDHFWFSNGYAEIPYPLLRVRPNGAYYGPYKLPSRRAPRWRSRTT